MIRITRKGPWLTVAGLSIVAAALGPLWVPDALPSDSESVIWGALMGVGLFALTSGVGANARAERNLEQTPTANALLAQMLTMLALCLLGMAFLLTGLGVIEVRRPPYVPNLAMMGGMLALSLLIPTTTQGFFLPAGDERFRLSQMRAMGLTLRVTLAALLILGAWDHYLPIDLPLVVILWGLLTLVATLYNATLWWLER